MSTISKIYKVNESKVNNTGALDANLVYELRGHCPTTVGLLPTGGNAKVQLSIGTEDEIVANTAHWTDWTPGDKGAYTEYVITAPYRYIRVYNTTATSSVLYICR